MLFNGNFSFFLSISHVTNKLSRDCLSSIIDLLAYLARRRLPKSSIVENHSIALFGYQLHTDHRFGALV